MTEIDDQALWDAGGGVDAGLRENLQDPFLRSVGILCVIAVVNQLVVSYVDMQLTWYRNMAYLGVLMGLVPVLPRVEPGRHATSPA